MDVGAAGSEQDWVTGNKCIERPDWWHQHIVERVHEPIAGLLADGQHGGGAIDGHIARLEAQADGLALHRHEFG